MTSDDLALGMRLKRQAGWNQTEADWRRFLALEPEGCLAADWDGQPMGTATAFVFGPVAWIAMVLVDESMRGRGVGTALMNHALRWLDQRGVPTVRLDATPLGRPIYQKLGFVDEYELLRFDGVLKALPTNGSPQASPTHAASQPIIAAPQPAPINAILDLDKFATGTPRARLIERLLTDQPEQWRVAIAVDGAVTGYITSRPGERATFIGPCVASDAPAGLALLNDAARRLAGSRIYIDIPRDNHPAIEWANQQGLVVQRSLYRMVRGRAVTDHVDQLWASSGPEKG